MFNPKGVGQFVDDKRGVSAVIGFILIFGILVLLLTTYQATIVPQQNAQTEFEHFEDNRNEMIQLRNSISTAGQSDVSQFPSVKLGTNYQTRLLTINPPPPAGTLQTSEPHNITISNGNEEDNLNITTRFLEYQPGYNEITIGPTRFEHSVLYLDERERGSGVSIIEEQNIVKDDKVRITALQNQFQQSGTGRVTLELYYEDEVDTSAFPEPENGYLTVKVPTRLSDDYWGDALSDSDSIYQGVDSGRLNLSVNESKLKVNTVGIQLEPNEGSAKNTDPHDGRGANNGGQTSMANNIELTNSETIGAGGSRVSFTLENTEDDTATIEEISINTVSNAAERVVAPGNNAELEQDGSDRLDETIEIDGTSYELDTFAEIPDSESSTFEFNRFRRSDGDQIDMGDSQIEILLTFSDGSEGTYTLEP